MLRETFAKELRHLQDEILRMGSEVEENLLKAVEALTRRDLNASERLVQADKWFNQRRIDIGHEAFGIIATQQPIAGDLRLIAATLEIAQAGVDVAADADHFEIRARAQQVGDPTGGPGSHPCARGQIIQAVS